MLIASKMYQFYLINHLACEERTESTVTGLTKQNNYLENV